MAHDQTWAKTLTLILFVFVASVFYFCGAMAVEPQQPFIEINSEPRLPMPVGVSLSPPRLTLTEHWKPYICIHYLWCFLASSLHNRDRVAELLNSRTASTLFSRFCFEPLIFWIFRHCNKTKSGASNVVFVRFVAPCRNIICRDCFVWVSCTSSLPEAGFPIMFRFVLAIF